MQSLLQVSTSSGYAFQMEVIVRAQYAKHSIAEVPIVFVDRVLGEERRVWGKSRLANGSPIPSCKVHFGCKSAASKGVKGHAGPGSCFGSMDSDEGMNLDQVHEEHIMAQPTLSHSHTHTRIN
eukprot:363648-Chlamydomonas_euryale.AAC.5